MKIKEGFVLREVMGQVVIVPTGSASEDFSGMIKLNDTGADIWKGIMDGKSKEEIVQDITAQYDVDKERVEKSFDTFVEEMVQKGFVEE